jgi:hypothetical protein
VVPLRDGIAREALTSLYALFGQAREILRRSARTWPSRNETANTTSGSSQWQC